MPLSRSTRAHRRSSPTEARRLDAVLVHFSTDYVFDGAAREPYVETSAANPLNVYGASKLEGERAIAAAGAHALVFRTSWIYALRGKNFLTTVQRLAAEREELRIVCDQAGVPNWSRALAEAIATLAAQGLAYLAERSGLYHLSAQGATTWHGFAQAIIGDAQHPRVIPIATAEYPTPARRPAYAVLDTRRFATTFGFELPHWRELLDNCLRSSEEPPRGRRDRPASVLLPGQRGMNCGSACRISAGLRLDAGGASAQAGRVLGDSLHLGVGHALRDRVHDAAVDILAARIGAARPRLERLELRIGVIGILA